MSHEGKAQQQGESDESCETYHFAQHRQLPFALVVQSHQYRLVYLHHHALYERVGLEAPLIALIVVTHRLCSVISAQQDVHHVAVNLCGYGRYQYLHAEAEHALHRAEINVPCGTPVAVIPQ